MVGRWTPNHEGLGSNPDHSSFLAITIIACSIRWTIKWYILMYKINRNRWKYRYFLILLKLFSIFIYLNSNFSSLMQCYLWRGLSFALFCLFARFVLFLIIFVVYVFVCLFVFNCFMIKIKPNLFQLKLKKMARQILSESSTLV